jgi:hypothetical protein
VVTDDNVNVPPGAPEIDHARSADDQQFVCSDAAPEESVGGGGFAISERGKECGARSQCECLTKSSKS